MVNLQSLQKYQLILCISYIGFVKKTIKVSGDKNFYYVDLKKRVMICKKSLSLMITQRLL
jgi:hypothetical protein